MGNKLIQGFRDKFNLEIVDARPGEGSDRNRHYDFEICIQHSGVNTWHKVEHKGGALRTIKPDEKPWLAGVQFHNGGCSKYSLAKQYAIKHYEVHISSGSLKETWSLVSPIPSFEEWWASDCCRQDDPKTPFGIELKQKVRNSRGPKGSLLQERKPVIDALEINSEVKDTLIKEVLPIANKALKEKHYWLTICGNLQNDIFNFAWNPNFIINTIENVLIEKKKDIFMRFHCSDGFSFNGILRWGKGAGFSCLRIDLK